MAEPVNEIPKEFAEIFAGISRIYKENKNNPDARPFISWITVIKGLLEKDLSGIPIIYTNLEIVRTYSCLR